ncbi:MAG: tetratricopeptide repeat protein [Acidobacteriota bacterium]
MTGRGILVGMLWLIAVAYGCPARAADSEALSTVLRFERTAVVEMRVAALIMSGQQGGGLPIALATLPSPDDPERFVAVVEIDGASLLESFASSEPSVALVPPIVELYAYVLGAELEVLDQLSAKLELEPDDHGGLLASTGLKLLVSLASPSASGRRQLRVLVRVGSTFGLRGAELAASDASQIQVWPPAFSEEGETWLVGLPVDEDVALPAPFGWAPGAVLPTSRALITAGQPLRGRAFSNAAPSQLVGLLRSPGEEAISVPLRRLEEAAPPSPAGTLPSVPFELVDSDLEPGLYELALALGPEDGSLPTAAEARSPSRFVPIFVASSAPSKAAASQTIAAPTSGTGKARGKRRRPPNRRLKELLGRISQEYLSALRQLTAGDRRTALATLSASEARIIEQFSADGVAILAAGQESALAGLADSDWGKVLPAMLLHLDLNRQYRRQRRFILVQHATRSVVARAQAAAAHQATPAASAEAARVVASLGTQYQLTGSLSQAKRLFEQALALSEDASALFGLATLLEKRGQFEQTVPVLERLVEVRPDLLEAHLRLAINRIRIDESPRAVRDALRRLAKQQQSQWVAVVAYQELARLELAEDDARAAVQLLRRALSRWPGHPTLTIQLVHALEARGDLAASLELLTSARFAPGGDAAGSRAARERSRYNAWAPELAEAERRKLDQLAGSRLESLAIWLVDQLATQPATRPAAEDES